MTNDSKEYSAKQLRIIRFGGVLTFIGFFIFIFLFTGNDRFLRRCVANGNSIKYCNDIYEDRKLAFKDKELEQEKKRKKKEIELAEKKRKEIELAKKKRRELKNKDFKSAPEVITSSNNSQIEFAKFLTEKGVVMYSAYWCPHCNDQKELFGEKASKELNIIECAQDGKNNKFNLCRRKEISGFPAWEIDNKIFLGMKTLQELSELAKYTGSTNFNATLIRPKE